MPVMGIHPCEKSWFHGRESGSRVLTMNSFLPQQKTDCTVGGERERQNEKEKEEGRIETRVILDREGEEERERIWVNVGETETLVVGKTEIQRDKDTWRDRRIDGRGNRKRNTKKRKEKQVRQ